MITFTQPGTAPALSLSEPPDSELRIQRALAIHLDWGRNFCAFNSQLFQWEADMYVVTHSGYLREYEIKVNWHDWLGDAEKDKFKTPRNLKDRMLHIKEFWYAVPASLYEKHGLPDSLRPEAGVLALDNVKGRLTVQQVRSCQPNSKASPINHERMSQLYRSAYFKFMHKQVGLRPVSVADDLHFPVKASKQSLSKV